MPKTSRSSRHTKIKVRLCELEFKNRQQESGVHKSSLPKPLALDTLRGRECRVVIYDLMVTCGDDAGFINIDFCASLAMTRATDTLIIVGSRELLTVFPQFWIWKNNRARRSRTPFPMTVQYAKLLGEAGLSFNPPTRKRTPCDFKVQKDWYKKDSGFHDWKWDNNNGSGERDN
jgi:hypothetical protein